MIIKFSENRGLKTELELERQGKTNEEVQFLEEENRKLKREINDLSSKNTQLSQEVRNNAFNTPITMWGYFGYGILFGIPLVGWIINLVFAFGGTQNINLKKTLPGQNFVYLILGVALVFLFFAMVAGGLAGSSYYYY